MNKRERKKYHKKRKAETKRTMFEIVTLLKVLSSRGPIYSSVDEDVTAPNSTRFIPDLNQ